jgi:phosphate transport system substrate-binding protein
MMIRKLTGALALSLLALACGDGQSAPGAGATAPGDRRPLTVKGSDTMVILGQRLAEEYMKENRGAVVQVNGGGSGTGIAALINGTVDLAQSSRPIKDAERKSIEQQRNAELVETPVALDALAVFVHASNPLRELSIGQVAAIYKGEVTNWSEVGGPSAPVVLYGRESSSGTYDYFREHVLGKADFSPRVQTLQGTAAIINAVARDRNAIGYGGIAYASDVAAVAIRGAEGPAVAPSEASVADGSYPLARHLYFYYPASSPERVKRFVDWSLGPAAQRLVASVGYFPLAPGAAEEAPASAATQ